MYLVKFFICDEGSYHNYYNSVVYDKPIQSVKDFNELKKLCIKNT